MNIYEYRELLKAGWRDSQLEDLEHVKITRLERRVGQMMATADRLNFARWLKATSRISEFDPNGNSGLPH